MKNHTLLQGEVIHERWQSEIFLVGIPVKQCQFLCKSLYYCTCDIDSVSCDVSDVAHGPFVFLLC